jgi:hypothetical protein
MAAYIRQRPAAWFRPVALLALLWGLAGCYAYYARAFAGADGDGYDAWIKAAYGLATLGGLLGAVALLRRSLWARPLFILSLGALIAQSGYALVATDLVAARGATAMLFPLVVALVTGGEVWFSAYARRRGWIA